PERVRRHRDGAGHLQEDRHPSRRRHHGTERHGRRSHIHRDASAQKARRRRVMTMKRETVTVLLADDDPDDRMLIEEAFGEIDSSYDLRFVDDGEELMDYLRHQGRFLEDTAAPKPAL